MVIDVEKYRVDASTGCHIWLGAKTDKGYPSLRVGNRIMTVTRMVLGLTERSVHACHRCDNPSCVNPAHLFAGSSSDNQRDSVQKGRHYKTRMLVCKNGHQLSGDNIYRPPGRPHTSRECLTCKKARESARGKRIRGES